MDNIEKNNLNQTIFKVTTILLKFIILVAFSVSIFYNIKLQEQLDKRDSLIKVLTFRDSIYDKVFEINYDSIKKTMSYSYRIENGKVLKYGDILNKLDTSYYVYNNFLYNHKKLLNDNKQTIENYNQLFNYCDSLNDNYLNLQYKYNDLVIRYNGNIDLTMKHINNYNLILDSLSNYKTVVDLLRSTYHIDYNIIREANHKKVIIKSEILDSALVLLPYFRDRLMKEKDVWIIKTIK